jgi:hypothetical protein
MNKFLLIPLATACLLCCTSTPSQSQVSFTDNSNLLQTPGALFSGIAVAISDMNGDGLDDVIRLNNGSLLSIDYQTLPGQAFGHFTHGNLPGEAWAVAVADANNDGFCDILSGGFYDGMKVLTAQNSASSYQQQILPGNSIFAQGSNFADINNDGWVDVFACHDDGESRIWANNGDGTFSAADNWIDMATTPPSDNSGNYGSVWTDFDNDGDLDLYIAKCRQGVNNPEDPRRINALFVNDGQNNYSEAAADYGLKIKWQSWTADFQDIDNDGDMDCLVTNHDYNLQLLENDGSGHFTDISQAAGIAVSGGFLQGIFRDFDNDGFMDILTSSPTHLFRNNGDKTFTEVPSPFGNTNPGTFAVGDLNHDGFLDVYAAYACGINNPCNVPDRMWFNAGNDNHFIALNLQGVQSNRMGIGARLELHGPWGIQIREVRSGESYGIMNSTTQHFGLGQDSTIDFLVVRWPSSTVDVIKNPAADQFLTAVEGSTCSSASFSLLPGNSAILCPGESLLLQAPTGVNHLWNNGATTSAVEVTETGTFSVVVIDSAGCASTSAALVVLENPDETPSLSITGETVFCQGGSVELTASEAASYLWSNGATTPSLTVTESGNYFVTTPGACGEFSSAAVTVEVLPRPDAPQAEDVILFAPAGVLVELTATGSHVFWYDDSLATTPIAQGNVFVTSLEDTTTFYLEDVAEYGGGSFETGMPAHQGSLFNGNTFNGQILFNALEDFVLKQVTVHTDKAGIRIIELRNSQGAVIDSREVDIPVGTSTLDLDLPVPAGNGYQLTTNQAQNQAELGTISPRLYRSDQDVDYPYIVQDVLEITGSNFGGSYYYYFYNWQIELPPLQCASDRSAVTVFFTVVSVQDRLADGAVSVSPNPSSGLFTLEINATADSELELQVCDPAGRTLRQHLLKTGSGHLRHVLDLGGLPAGLYVLKIRDGEQTGAARLVISR